MIKVIFGMLVVTGLISVGFLQPDKGVRTIPLPQQEASLETIKPQNEKQKKHSKLYQRYSGGKKVSDLQAEQPGDIVIRKSIGQPFRVRRPESAASGSLVGVNQYLYDLVSDADVIVVGIIQDGISKLTESEDFLFTDFELHVDQVIQNRTGEQISEGSVISVTQPGGVIQLSNKRSIKAMDPEFTAFKKGEHYILFLDLIPETGGYKSFRNGSFLISDGKVSKLTNSHLWDEINSRPNAESFIDEIRKATATSSPSPSNRRLFD